VEQTLQGNAPTLKERVIAVELFGRDESAELGEDPIVRGAAREVRRRLALFYSSPEAQGCEMRIQLPTGTYVPEFERVAAKPATEEERPQALAIASDRPRVSRTALAVVILAAAQLATGMLWFYSTRSHAQSNPKARAAVQDSPDFIEFWRPYLRAGRSIIVALPWLPEQPAQSLAPKPLAQEPYRSASPAALGNMAAGLRVSSQIAAFLGDHGATALVRTLAEPAKAPAIPTPTILLALEPGTVRQQLPMRFVQSRDRFDVVTNSGRRWTAKSVNSDVPYVHEDLVLVTRLVQTEDAQPSVIIEDIDGHGAEAVAQVLTIPALFTACLKGSLPMGWEERNLQLLLHAHVVNGMHTSPTVVDAAVWDKEDTESW
jgi:hypothetical protein